MSNIAFSIQVPQYADWYKLAGEFFQSCGTGATREQIESGHKTLALAYVGIQAPLSAMEEVSARAIFTLAVRKVIAAKEEARHAR